ncbi:hypothetical protein W59_28111 [Rhodococcus opacus RKJ300 = JCM 13270]|uniref:Uncharacterized protein n=1 Tax=Rhodococcus opacus RKJ300 = JCM 13270 TaxID=1165867 RepID=I0WG24_RHOOP|nr:hypothetical protein W59_28111 [Rhodococcus opacus RKJ300 = JCM 13270]
MLPPFNFVDCPVQGTSQKARQYGRAGLFCGPKMVGFGAGGVLIYGVGGVGGSRVGHRMNGLSERDMARYWVDTELHLAPCLEQVIFGHAGVE